MPQRSQSTAKVVTAQGISWQRINKKKKRKEKKIMYIYLKMLNAASKPQFAKRKFDGKRVET